MFNFISYSLVLAAKGKTKELMKVSCGALIVNLIINLLLYKCMGFMRVTPMVMAMLVNA